MISRLLLGTVLAASLISCEDSADSPECREWQSNYITWVSINPMYQRLLLEGNIDMEWAPRPDGCPIPDVVVAPLPPPPAVTVVAPAYPPTYP